MTEYYSWVGWIMKLAEKISDNGESYLIEKSNEVDRNHNNPPLLSYGDGGVDPFSFFYFLAQKNTENQVLPVFKSVHEEFELDGDFPQSEIIIPTPPPHAIVPFHDGKATNRDLLWTLFRSSVGNGNNINQQVFSEVLNLRNVGVKKLTQTLFIINPLRFFPIDEKVSLLGKKFSNLERKINQGGYQTYKSTIDKIRQYFPGCEFFEINRFLYGQNRGDFINSESKFFQVSTNVYDNGSDYWELNQDNPEIELTFKEKSIVYVGGSGSERRPYPLTIPKPGDIVLVRKGRNQGKGIGVVYQNEYSQAGGYRENYVYVIRVIWINKSPSELPSPVYVQDGFTHACPATISAFESSDTYRGSLEFIGKLMVEEITSEPINVEKIIRNNVDYPLNTIFYGPPGSGKTYATTQRCVEICNGTGKRPKEEFRREFNSLVQAGRVQFVTFHQSYSYEEFVEGLRPTPDSGGGFQLDPSDGVIKRIAERARNNRNDHYVLVIDEINRANISKVLGELITLLEEDKREGMENEVTMTLPYSGNYFSLPPNLYILGTMNTADRSIALLDTALRRRFDFEEMMPEPKHLNGARESTGVDLPEVLRTINARIEYLKDRDHLIGHAWLMKARDRKELDQIMRTKIIPLIAEYFHDDWQNVRAILGGTDDFVSREILSVPPGLEAAYDDRYSWKINGDFPEDAYANLISGITSNSN